jgi:hypothetical protein
MKNNFNLLLIYFLLRLNALRDTDIKELIVTFKDSRYYKTEIWWLLKDLNEENTRIHLSSMIGNIKGCLKVAIS